MANPYEQQKLLVEYLLLHYAERDALSPWRFLPREADCFPERCVREHFPADSVPPTARALELGCAVGRACFELSAFCVDVLGLDYSERFIETARTLAKVKTLQVDAPDEGELTSKVTINLRSHHQPERTRFVHGDATALPDDLGTFEIVLACNLLCRLPRPRKLLERFPSLVCPGGRLLLTSPYTWMTEYTPREEWLGGYVQEGRAVVSLETLRSVLEPSFTLLRRTDMPFMIREHQRKFQWSVAEATLWKRN